MRKFYDFIIIIVGCLLAAFGTAIFLLPNKLSTGGFAGIGTIMYYLFNIPMGTTIVVLNIPFFILGYFKIGLRFILKTIFATILYSKLIDLFSGNINLIQDVFLSSIYGGILVGLGLALVLKGNASTGGSELIAHLAQKYNSKMKISSVLIILDVAIIGANLIVFGNIEIGLYSVIAICIVGKMIDIVFEGINFCKIIYIISDYSESILEKIKEADLGATGLYGKGSYTQKDKTIIMCVTKRSGLMNIKNFAKEIDKNCFIIIADAREVYGLGFKS